MDGLKITPAILRTIALLILISSTMDVVESHTSIAYPTPISYLTACRVGDNVHCPGPCPNQLHRRDRSITIIQRDRELKVITRKNNHYGGFIRWSLVKVEDMWKKDKHARGAFFYTCHDVRRSICSYENRKWCKGDKTNQHYAHKVRIPPIFPDGNYVLGMAWYGGLFATKTIGNFGDYYDCMYIRISGGPLVWEYKPTYAMGPSITGKYGQCKATVNRIGYCWMQPCEVNGQSRIGQYFKPWEFSDGREPKKLRRLDYM